MASDYLEGQKAQTANGNRVMKENLQIVSMGNGHIIFDGDSCTILCLGHYQLNGMINYPITWRARAEAQKWIDGGTIGDLQERFSCLAVSFTNQLVIPPKWQTRSADPYYQEKVYG